MAIDSAKLLNSHVDGLVSSRVNQMMGAQQQQVNQNQIRAARAQEAAAFMKKHNMSKEEFQDMMVEAKKKPMTLDDVYHLMNKEKTSANVAKSTKNDMMEQMKNVRGIPTTAGGINSPRAEQTPDDSVFDDVLGSDKGISELFG